MEDGSNRKLVTRRLGRHLFTAAAAVSLMVCVAAATVWASGCHRGFGQVWNETAAVDRPRLCGSLGDGVTVGVITPGPPPSPVVSVYRVGFSLTYASAYAGRRLSSFRYRLGTYRGVGVPFWAIIVSGAVLPAFWTVSFLRHRRRLSRPTEPLCPACGYDLRATPGRCPECGAMQVGSPEMRS